VPKNIAGSAAAWFNVEKDRMYSRRESQLIQQYVLANGKMPGGRDEDLEGLF